MNEDNTHHLPYFDEVNKMYTMREAIEEAKRCLHCKVPQCKKGCPIENNIPDFIHELSKGNMGEAMAILHEKTNLPAICGRVCPHEKQCEGHCVLGRRDNPVRVGKLESFIAQFDAEMNLTHERIPEKNTRQGGRHRLRPRRPYRGRRPGAPGLQCHHIRRAARARRRADVRHTRIPTAQSRGAQRN